MGSLISSYPCVLNAGADPEPGSRSRGPVGGSSLETTCRRAPVRWERWPRRPRGDGFSPDVPIAWSRLSSLPDLVSVARLPRASLLLPCFSSWLPRGHPHPPGTPSSWPVSPPTPGAPQVGSVKARLWPQNRAPRAARSDLLHCLSVACKVVRTLWNLAFSRCSRIDIFSTHFHGGVFAGLVLKRTPRFWVPLQL